jgi:hypothetical protein
MVTLIWQNPPHSVAQIIKPAASAAVHRSMPPRRWYLGGKVLTYETPLYLTPEEDQQLQHRLAIAHSEPRAKANHAERAFTEALRSVSARRTGVGPHRMSILLPAPKVGVYG